MNKFTHRYLLVTLIAVGAVMVFLIPDVAVFSLIVSSGLTYLLFIPALTIVFFLVVFAPAVLFARFNLLAGLGIAALTAVALFNHEYFLTDHAHEGLALLDPPFAAQGPVTARSLEIDVDSIPRKGLATRDELVQALLANRDLDWIRLRTTRKTQLYVRQGGLVLATEDDGRAADVVVRRTRFGGDILPDRAFTPYALKGAEGFIILARGQDAPLARNLSLELLRMQAPWVLTLENMNAFIGPVDPYVDFHRVSVGKVTRDASRLLEDDLRELGVLPMESPPARDTPDRSGQSDVEALDAIMLTILDKVSRDESSLQMEALLTPVERQVLEQFIEQIKQRVRIEDRIEIIAQANRIFLIHAEITMPLADEYPALMARMVELFHSDVIAQLENREGPRIPRLYRFQSSGREPFLFAIGRDPETYERLLRMAEPYERDDLYDLIWHIGLDDPYALLRIAFEPFAPPSEVEERLTQDYYESWASTEKGQRIIARRNEYWPPLVGSDAERDNADDVMLDVVRRETVPPEIVLEFALRWVMTREYPFQFSATDARSMLKALDSIGAAEEHEALSNYFGYLNG